MHIWIIVGTKAVVAAVAAVIAAAAVATPQTQTEQIAVVVRCIGKVLEIQVRFVLKIAINGNGGRDDHELTIFTVVARRRTMLTVTLSGAATSLIGNGVQ